MSIDNDRDLSEYVGAHYSKVPPTTGEVTYERHPVSISISSISFGVIL